MIAVARRAMPLQSAFLGNLLSMIPLWAFTDIQGIEPLLAG